jgi:hypothetical protein
MAFSEALQFCELLQFRITAMKLRRALLDFLRDPLLPQTDLVSGILSSSFPVASARLP